MILFFYNLALLVALVVGAPWWLLRMATTQKYREGLGARLGRVPQLEGQRDRPLIWVHAVSVGEVLAVSRLVKTLDAVLPGYFVAISTTTRTGQELAREHFGANRVFYCPLDLPWAVRAYLNALQPRMLVLAETEFWPNLLSGCFRREIPVAVVNGRISDRSWPRYRRMRALWRPLLGRISRVLAQSDLDEQRLIAIGCDADCVSVAGNLKFDIRAAWEADATRILKALKLGNRLVVAGSTLEGEEAALLEAWPKLLEASPRPGLVLVVAPRHPERFDGVAALLDESGFSWKRRTEWLNQRAGAIKPLKSGQIVLLDTIGELASVYSLASVAFVGGSLIPAGGHNPLEPAQFAVPIVIGPNYANFRDITEYLRDHQAIRIAETSEFSDVLIELLGDSAGARAMGERARQVFERQSGATERCVLALRNLIGEEAPAVAAGTVAVVPDPVETAPVLAKPLVVQAKAVSLDPPHKVAAPEPVLAVPENVGLEQVELVEADPVSAAEPTPELAPLPSPAEVSGVGKPELVRLSEPIELEPSEPEPVEPTPPEPVELERVELEPVELEPVELESAQELHPGGEPAEPVSVEPEPVVPAQAPEAAPEPEPAMSGPMTEPTTPDEPEPEAVPPSEPEVVKIAPDLPEPVLPEPVAELVSLIEPTEPEPIQAEPPAPEPVEEVAPEPEAMIPAECEPVEEPPALREPDEPEPALVAAAQPELALHEPEAVPSEPEPALHEPEVAPAEPEVAPAEPELAAPISEAEVSSAPAPPEELPPPVITEPTLPAPAPDPLSQSKSAPSSSFAKSSFSTRKFLLPLVPLYRLGQIMRDKKTGAKAASRLRHPVVSIGNLSTGGAGKTPLTIALVAALEERGFHVDVLSRGFGRTGQHPIRVATGGTAEEFGDEPLLIARASGAPVYVAAERYDAGLLAEGDAAAIAFLGEKLRPVIHLLDDGFQHRQLARAVDILLLDREDWTGSLLPAGNLREPIKAIQRANIVAIPADEAELERELRAWGWQGPVWRLRREMSVPPVEGPVAAFCGIARPAQFFAGIEAAGVHLATRAAFADHHPYTAKDLETLIAAGRAGGAVALMTTEKDQVRLGKLLGGISGALPLKTVALRTEIEDLAEAIGSLTAQLKPATP